MSDTGALSSLGEGEISRRTEELQGRVLDICVTGGQPTVLTVPAVSRSVWTVRRLGEMGWTVQFTIPVADEDGHPEAMVCDATRITIATQRRLVTLTQHGQASLALNGRHRKGFVRAVAGTADAVYIGFYMGEWGGGLERIDRTTGAITSVVGKIDAPYCKKPIDPACDPVNGIAPEPWTSSCVVAAIGLEHLSPTGRLVEVCGDAVTEIYHKPWGSAAPYSDVPFYGVARVGDRLLAVAADGLYAIDRSGTRQIMPLPAFHRVDGIAVSFAAPGLVLVMRDIGVPSPASHRVPILLALKPQRRTPGDDGN